jgi:hypothetical protein
MKPWLCPDLVFGILAVHRNERALIMSRILVGLSNRRGGNNKKNKMMNKSALYTFYFSLITYSYSIYGVTYTRTEVKARLYYRVCS